MDYSFKESFYKNTSDTIVIFIHGITESPNQFKQLNKIVLKNGHSLVSIKSAQTIKNILKNFNKRKNKNIIIILKQSGHFNYSLKDKLIIFNNFDKFLKYIV